MLIYRPKERTALDMFYLHTKFGDFRINCSGGMIGGGGVKTENESFDSDHASFRGGLSSLG